MQPKTIKIIYWTLTIIFALLMLLDGTAGFMRVEGGQEAMQHLGYPIYTLSILGTAKILGAIALLQTSFQTIKEWAYAGFTINFIGASASHYFTGDGIGMIIMPIIILGVMFLTYLFWKNFQQLKILHY